MGYMQEYENWLACKTLDDQTRRELEAITADPKEIEERFYAELEFGTAGLRGVIGAGTNRMNIYVVQRATQGISDYINALPGAAQKGVVIAYDSRLKSDEFALSAALVFCANGIKTYLFSTLHSVPQLSFAVRHLGCTAGIVITASHNPPQYNGYKVYWEEGGQICVEMAAEITRRIRAVGEFCTLPMDKQAAIDAGLLQMIGEEVDEAYFKALKSLLIAPEVLKTAHLSVIYTPLHGTGNVPVRRILTDLGVHVSVVPEQEKPDPLFPTVKAPNPENAEAFSLAEKLADEKGADVIFATDPDADRLGVAVRDKSGKFVILTGNQIGCLLEYYVLSRKKALGTLPPDSFVVKSIVSTNMANAIAKSFGVEMVEVLTGFRFIGEKITEREKNGTGTFQFGFEESYGYLVGTFARDKDAICACMMLSEASGWYASRSMTLYDALTELFKIYGYYGEKTVSYTLTGREGMEKISAAMAGMRAHPPAQIASARVVAVRDYETGMRSEPESGHSADMGMQRANVLYYELEDGSWACVRPSGTEPKLKLYVNAKASGEYELSDKIEAYVTNVDALLAQYLK